MNTLVDIKLGGSILHIKSRIKDKKRHGSDNIEGLGDEQDFKEKLGGKNAVNWGDKIRLNATPTDSTGHRMEGADDANFEATYDRAWDQIPKENDGYIFTEWWWDGEYMGGPIILGSYGDNFGCTSTLKVDKSAEDDGRHKLEVQCVYAKVKRNECRSNMLEFAID